MCIAIIIQNLNPRFPLVVFHSREEDVDRPSTLPTKHNGEILSSIDLRAGGVAAVGMNVRTGRFCVLTNCRFREGIHADGISRGSLIQRVLQGDELSSYEYSKRQFQGFFHLYCGNTFIRTPTDSHVTYITNIGGDLRSSDLSTTEPKITVRMNEHPSTVGIWKKREILYSQLLCDFSRLRVCHSVQDLMECIQHVFDVASMQLAPQIFSDASWSLFPLEAEQIAQSYLVIPPFKISPNNAWFGTVSQTCMIVDGDSSIVRYLYRSMVDPLDHRVQKIGEWSHIDNSFS